MRTSFVVSILALNACGGASDSEVRELRASVRELATQVEELKAANDQLRATQTAHEITLSTHATTVAAAESLLELVSVTPEGDVVVSGANIYVQSGSGATSGVPNGKGNLIVGYDEPLERGTCSGGSEAGNPCQASFACPGGTCMGIQPVSAKTGSHNLVVGPGHSYSAYGGFVAGLENTVSGINASVTGGTGIVADGAAEVLP